MSQIPSQSPCPLKAQSSTPPNPHFAFKQPGVITKSALCLLLSASVPSAWSFEYFMSLMNGCWSRGGDGMVIILLLSNCRSFLCGSMRGNRELGFLVLLCLPVPIPLILPSLESLREMQMTLHPLGPASHVPNRFYNLVWRWPLPPPSWEFLQQ